MRNPIPNVLFINSHRGMIWNEGGGGGGGGGGR